MTRVRPARRRLRAASGATALLIAAALAVSVVPAAAIGAGPTSTRAATASADAPAAGPADLILLPGPVDQANPLGMSNRTPSLIANKDVVQGLRGTLAGITLDFPTSWEAMTPGYEVDVAQETATYVTPLLESGVLEGFDHNLVLAQIRPDAGWTDQAAWERIYRNFDVLAQYSVATGSRGLFFDIENYHDVAADGTPWDEGLLDWEQGVDGSLEQTQALARQRGRELMSTVLARQPDAEVLFSLGSVQCGSTSVGGNADQLELQCPFMAGALDAATAPNQVLDGGEQYKLRTAEDFDSSAEWREGGILDEPEMDFLSAKDEQRWTDYLGQSNGLQTKWKFDRGYDMTPAAYSEALYQALTTNDSVTWAYTTGDDMLRPGFPAEWRQAMDDAVARAEAEAEPEPAPEAPSKPGKPGKGEPSDDTATDLVLFPGPSDAENPLGPSNRTASLVANADTVQGLRGTFAGITLDFPTGWMAMEPGYEADVAQETESFVTPLIDSGVLEGFDHNLVRAQVRPDPAWTDDAAWARITDNFGALAQYSVATGSRGILFDIENYQDVRGDGTPWDDGLLNWDEGVDGTLADAQALARQRGAELMQAVLAVQPDAEVIFSRGSIDCSEAPADVDPYIDPTVTELQCPFISGALDAATAPNQVIDGGQLYYMRDAESFDQAYSWRDSGLLAEPEMAYMSDADQSRWTDYLGQSNGVMNKWRQQPEYDMTPEQYEEALYQALRVDDSMTWAYIAEDDILRPGFPAEWREAIDRAVARAKKG